MKTRALVLAWMVLTASAAQAASTDTVRIGYWTSGFSAGFGAVLEAGHFAEHEGLVPDYIKFSDVNGPTKALLTHSIDIAFAAPATGAFTLGAQGAPVKIVLATQIAEASFVARENSPLRTLADLRGKKLGMSPAGSATYAIAAAVLEKNYGLKLSDFTAVPGNEGPLAFFLARGDIDAAALRAVTLASIPDLKVRTFGTLVGEWKKMMHADAMPILGVTLAHDEFLRQHPDAAVKFLRAVLAATAFGARDPAAASAILSRSAHLPAADAKSYVRQWNNIYMARLAPQDVATLKAMAGIFVRGGTLEGRVPDALFDTKPYELAKPKP